MNTLTLRTLALAAAAASLATGAAQAQSSRQVVRPPEAQAWIDVATFSGMGMPMGGPGGGAPNPMAALGGLFGSRGGAKVPFLMTHTGGSGRYVDVTVMSRRNAQLAEAQQDVPAGFMSPALKLVAPRDAPTLNEPDEEVVPEPDTKRPEGRLYLYWGCGETVRAGQPRVIDFAKATPAELAQAFQSRRATQRGAHSAAGRPHWPNATDGRAVPEGASLVGSHQLSGNGLPESFKFAVAAAQDLMPPLQLQQADRNGALALSWAALPTARAYFISGMGARGQNEMVIWTSSELPDAGFGLVDYQTNPAVDRWLKDKVLLQPGTTQCTVPKGVFSGEGAMLRAIAYGSELNLAHPPRPSDPTVAWEPEWAVKLRVKSVASTVVGMPSMESAPGGNAPERAPEGGEKKEKKNPLDLLRGVIGR